MIQTLYEFNFSLEIRSEIISDGSCICIVTMSAPPTARTDCGGIGMVLQEDMETGKGMNISKSLMVCKSFILHYRTIVLIIMFIRGN